MKRVGNKIGDQINDQVYYSIRDQVYHNFRNISEYQAWNPHHVLLRIQVCDQVYHPLKNSL